MLYRLYTENTPEALVTVRHLLAEHGFTGATLQGGIGIWEGDTEKSLVVEISSDMDLEGRITSLAKAICIALGQWQVNVVALPSESWYVKGEKRQEGKEVMLDELHRSH